VASATTTSSAAARSRAARRTSGMLREAWSCASQSASTLRSRPS
jgi:hypothetical protein